MKNPIRTPEQLQREIDTLQAQIVAIESRAQRRHQLQRDLFQITSRHHQVKPMLDEVLAAIYDLSGCMAVAIRLLDERGNIPYEAYLGFRREFYESESPLSLHTDQCMCVRVIRGETDPALSFYTRCGSFYMNATNRFLATVSEEEKGKTRNACNREGYESVALVPIRTEESILGLIHLADKRENMVPMDLVELLEDAAVLLASSLLRLRAEEEKLRIERRLLQSQKLESLGALAGGVAHEFNNILAGIVGYADLVLRQVPAGAPARDDIDVIKKEARRANELTRQILTYAGKGPAITGAVNLSQIVEGTRAILCASVSKDAAITYDLSADLPCVSADAVQMSQVLMNLATNASEAIGKNAGAITIATRTAHCGEGELASLEAGQSLPGGLYVCLEVTDTGCGMDERTAERIFEPFFTTKFTGRGLGLASVHGIVRGHRGTIQVHSEPGKGTTLRVFLPAAPGL